MTKIKQFRAMKGGGIQSNTGGSEEEVPNRNVLSFKALHRTMSRFYLFPTKGEKDQKYISLALTHLKNLTKK